MELLSKNKNRLIAKKMIQASVWECEEYSDAALYNFYYAYTQSFLEKILFIWFQI